MLLPYCFEVVLLLLLLLLLLLSSLLWLFLLLLMSLMLMLLFRRHQKVDLKLHSVEVEFVVVVVGWSVNSNNRVKPNSVELS